MIKLTDNHGNLLPALRNIVNIIFLCIGLVGGWFAHVNWSLRGEASVLVADEKFERKNKEQTDKEMAVVRENMQESRNAELDACLRETRFPSGYLDKLRDSRGETE